MIVKTPIVNPAHIPDMQEADAKVWVGRGLISYTCFIDLARCLYSSRLPAVLYSALVAVIGYLVGGIVFMKFVKGAEGKEIIPNVTLWMGIPGLIKDGALFIKSKLTGFKSDANYETL